MSGLSLAAVSLAVAPASSAAQRSAIGASIGAKEVAAFGWTRGNERDGILRVVYAEPTPWDSTGDGIVELALLVGQHLTGDSDGWTRGALGLAWVAYSPGDESEGGETVGLAGQLDAVVEFAGPGVSGVAMGFVAMTNLNAQASYVSLGVALHLLR